MAMLELAPFEPACSSIRQRRIGTRHPALPKSPGNNSGWGGGARHGLGSQDPLPCMQRRRVRRDGARWLAALPEHTITSTAARRTSSVEARLADEQLGTRNACAEGSARGTPMAPGNRPLTPRGGPAEAKVPMRDCLCATAAEFCGRIVVVQGASVSACRMRLAIACICAAHSCLRAGEAKPAG
eukprot:363231-Chlamydomonas_euryale.AAC.5